MEISSNPILSICIPTYNRAELLKITLESIASQKRFSETDDVEIVISDNCSTDSTSEVVEHYLEKYKNKIIYSRNDENILDMNFEKVLSLGRATYLKLNNDTLKHNAGSLDKMLKVIQTNIDKKPVIFFSNGTVCKTPKIYCADFDAFIKNASYWVTWIGAFGIWKEDFEKINDFNRYSYLQLAQMDVLLRSISSSKTVVIINEQLCENVAPNKKGGYDFLNVFLDNYLFILSEYFNAKRISIKTLKAVKRHLLFKLICPVVALSEMGCHYQFKTYDKFNKIICHYKKDPIAIIGGIYFYLACYLKTFIKSKILGGRI